MKDLEIKKEDEKLDIVIQKLNLITALLQKKLEYAQKRKWVSEKEAQSILDKSPTSLWRLRKAKKLVWTKNGKSILYDLQSIHQYLNENLSN
jgi:hypothetical protein